MPLFFVNHPDTRNLEFSFGALAKGAKANVTGFVTIRRTDPGLLTSVSSPGPTPTPKAHTFEAETHFSHQIGRRDADGWSVNVKDVFARYLAYGPYTTAVAGGARSATWRLLLDNVTADNARVLTLDVYDAAGRRVLATRDLRRRDFSRAGTYQDFALNFTNPANSRLEFRVFFHGYSYVRFDRAVVK